MAIYKHSWGDELGNTEKQLQQVAKVGFEPGATELKSSALNHSAMLAEHFTLEPQYKAPPNNEHPI